MGFLHILGSCAFNKPEFCSTVALLLKKNLLLSRPAQFKTVLFKGQPCSSEGLRPTDRLDLAYCLFWGPQWAKYAFYRWMLATCVGDDEYVLSPFSCVSLAADLLALAPQAALSVGFSRQEHWSWYSHSLFQGIFPTQESNPHLLHCRQILYCLSQGSPHWAIVFSLPDMKCSVSVLLLSCVWLFATPRTAACPASLSITNFQSLLKLMSFESVMPSDHFILCHILSSCLQSFAASGFFPVSQFFPSGGQSIGVSASASVLSMNIQNWFHLGLTGLISLESKGLSRVFSNTTVQKHWFLGTELSLWSCSNIRTWLLEKPLLWLMRKKDHNDAIWLCEW